VELILPTSECQFCLVSARVYALLRFVHETVAFVLVQNATRRKTLQTRHADVSGVSMRVIGRDEARDTFDPDVMFVITAARIVE